MVSNILYHPCLGRWSDLTSIFFQMGWNYQLDLFVEWLIQTLFFRYDGECLHVQDSANTPKLLHLWIKSNGFLRVWTWGGNIHCWKMHAKFQWKLSHLWKKCFDVQQVSCWASWPLSPFMRKWWVRELHSFVHFSHVSSQLSQNVTSDRTNYFLTQLLNSLVCLVGKPPEHMFSA